MKYFRPVLFSILILFSFSCKLILLKKEGIKQPALESYQSLSKFMLSYGIDTSQILCFRDTSALNGFYKKHIGLPDARFFNRDKIMVDYRTPNSNCNGQISPLIEKVDSINEITPVQGKVLDDFLKGVVVERTGRDFDLGNQPYDVYLVVYWAKYLGKLNKHKVLEWQNMVQKANMDRKKIRFILVNTDYQSNWGIKPSDVPRFKY